MKIKDILNIKNIYNFIEGNIKYHASKLLSEPYYIREQRLYRLSQCKDDCVVNNECIECGCPTDKKVYNDESCNPERFPDLMNNEDWIEFKKQNNIND